MQEYLLSVWHQAHMVPTGLAANLLEMPRVTSSTRHSTVLDLHPSLPLKRAMTD
jgi:hypothetical protein